MNRRLLSFIQIFFVGCSASGLAMAIPLKSLQLTQNGHCLNESSPPLNLNNYLCKKHNKSYQYLSKVLNQAINDTQTQDENKIVRNLWALSTSNPRIQWRKNENTGEIEYRMVKWTSEERAKAWQDALNKGAKEPEIDIQENTFLTAFPQVQEFCRNCKGSGMKIPGEDMLTLRIQEYLGLILEQKYSWTYFAEMWVSEKNLARPCTDTEINDFSCQKWPGWPQAVPASLKQATANFPWTGLGYTYDWGNPQKPHVGASEFIIKKSDKELASGAKNVKARLISVMKTNEYCPNKNLSANNFSGKEKL